MDPFSRVTVVRTPMEVTLCRLGVKVTSGSAWAVAANWAPTGMPLGR
jgi:hypothetical protein